MSRRIWSSQSWSCGGGDSQASPASTARFFCTAQCCAWLVVVPAGGCVPADMILAATLQAHCPGPQPAWVLTSGPHCLHSFSSGTEQGLSLLLRSPLVGLFQAWLIQLGRPCCGGRADERAYLV